MGTAFGAALGILIALYIENIRRIVEIITGSDLFAQEIYFLSRLPSSIDWSEVAGIVLLSFILSFGATLYPSWKASKLDPVEALRHE